MKEYECKPHKKFNAQSQVPTNVPIPDGATHVAPIYCSPFLKQVDGKWLRHIESHWVPVEVIESDIAELTSFVIPKSAPRVMTPEGAGTVVGLEGVGHAVVLDEPGNTTFSPRCYTASSLKPLTEHVKISEFEEALLYAPETSKILTTWLKESKLIEHEIALRDTKFLLETAKAMICKTNLPERPIDLSIWVYNILFNLQSNVDKQIDSIKTLEACVRFRKQL
ncbi:TPA: hypothetical protein I7730_15705 [Vibrio vulnificus]|uniref:Uncharacterized protein n=1 Tax=Vibrio vulnificus TaxID=672 RepID=A0A8H9N1P5_VIBVL|nr:hypothetical protein [Vibrio vulnificus]HAS8541227.1 hypothetical protein [Vibrio vulnificus]